MRKLRIYLDTSVLNYYFADDNPEEQNATRKLFQEIKEDKHEAFISAAVIDEVEAAEEPVRERLKKLVLNYYLKILEPDPEVEQLARRYIENKIIPEKYGKDASHIAYAAIFELDAIVSWNFKHIVKLKTRTMVNGVNKLEGYREIEICSPLEVIENE